jgi:hypothetical protein
MSLKLTGFFFFGKVSRKIYLIGDISIHFIFTCYAHLMSLRRVGGSNSKGLFANCNKNGSFLTFSRIKFDYEEFMDQIPRTYLLMAINIYHFLLFLE